MLTILLRVWRWLVVIFIKPDKASSKPIPSPIEHTPPPEPPTPPPPPDIEPVAPNRHMRRTWDRARRKQDKFVTPKGPKPTPIPRVGHNRPPAKPIAPAIADENFDIIQGNDGMLYAESELYGVYNFRDTILDQLDRYWVYLRRMRLKDPQAYGLYKQIGATVVPLMSWIMQDGINAGPETEEEKREQLQPLSPWWRQNRPAFGCVCYGMSSIIEREEMLEPTVPHKKGQLRWVPKFLYFTKYKNPPPHVQQISGGDVYILTVWWDRPFDPAAKKLKGGIPQDFAVFISYDGDDVHVLPMRKLEFIPIPSHKNGLDKFDIPRRSWGLPRDYVDWAKGHNHTPQYFLTRLFLEAAHAVERAQYSMLRVAVTNKDLTAVFGVEVKRVPYFFQDRDIVLNERGIKKRIFHIVRAHVRKDGTPVPFHFRGMREFDWADYHVKITVPGRDHFMMSDFNVGAVDGYWMRKKDGLDQPQLGKRLVDSINSGLGGRR